MARTLNLALAISDLCSGTYNSLHLATTLWSEKDPECASSNQSLICEDSYYYYMKLDDDILCTIGGIIKYPTSLSSIIITSHLTIARYLQIKFPLQPPPKKILVGSLVGCLVYYTGWKALFAFLARPDGQVWSVRSGQCYHPLGLIIFEKEFSSNQLSLFAGTCNILAQFAGIVCGALTLRHLVKKYRNPLSGNTSNYAIGSIKVLILNSWSFFYFTLMRTFQFISLITTNVIPETLEDFIEMRAGIPYWIVVVWFLFIRVTPTFIGVSNAITSLAFTQKARQWRLPSTKVGVLNLAKNKPTHQQSRV